MFIERKKICDTLKIILDGKEIKKKKIIIIN